MDLQYRMDLQYLMDLQYRMNFQMFWRNILLELLQEWNEYFPNKKKSIRIHGDIYREMT